MGFIRKSLVTAVFAKVAQEARKPENQRKVKQFIAARRGQTRRTGPRGTR